MTPRARGTLLLNSLGGVMILAVVAALCMASGLFGEALEGEGLSWKLILALAIPFAGGIRFFWLAKTWPKD